MRVAELRGSETEGLLVDGDTRERRLVHEERVDDCVLGERTNIRLYSIESGDMISCWRSFDSVKQSGEKEGEITIREREVNERGRR